MAMDWTSMAGEDLADQMDQLILSPRFWLKGDVSAGLSGLVGLGGVVAHHFEDRVRCRMFTARGQGA